MKLILKLSWNYSIGFLNLRSSLDIQEILLFSYSSWFISYLIPISRLRLHLKLKSRNLFSVSFCLWAKEDECYGCALSNRSSTCRQLGRLRIGISAQLWNIFVQLMAMINQKFAINYREHFDDFSDKPWWWNLYGSRRMCSDKVFHRRFCELLRGFSKAFVA